MTFRMFVARPASLPVDETARPIVLGYWHVHGDFPSSGDHRDVADDRVG